MNSVADSSFYKQASPFSRRLWALRGSPITEALFRTIYGPDMAKRVGRHFYGKPIATLFRPTSEAEAAHSFVYPKRLPHPSIGQKPPPPPAPTEPVGLGPYMSMEEFLHENPYNGFTVYKGGNDHKIVHGMATRPDEQLWVSGRPTTALDHHLRPLRGDTKDPHWTLATGDIRRGESFRKGDRFFTPHTASPDINEQIRTTKGLTGTQRFYRTGYHSSANVPDYEISSPMDEIADVLDKYYVVEPTEGLGFVPFGRFAETHIDPATFKDMPFRFRRVLDPDAWFKGPGLGTGAPKDPWAGVPPLIDRSPNLWTQEELIDGPRGNRLRLSALTTFGPEIRDYLKSLGGVRQIIRDNGGARSLLRRSFWDKLRGGMADYVDMLDTGKYDNLHRRLFEARIKRFRDLEQAYRQRFPLSRWADREAARYYHNRAVELNRRLFDPSKYAERMDDLGRGIVRASQLGATSPSPGAYTPRSQRRIRPSFTGNTYYPDDYRLGEYHPHVGVSTYVMPEPPPSSESPSGPRQRLDDSLQRAMKGTRRAPPPQVFPTSGSVFPAPSAQTIAGMITQARMGYSHTLISTGIAPWRAWLMACARYPYPSSAAPAFPTSTGVVRTTNLDSI